MPAGRHDASPRELAERLGADRRGTPYLVLRDPDGAQRLVELAGDRDQLTIGRLDANDVSLPWDRRVSRVHARLERVGARWTVVDDGLSRNGTFVNGLRVGGRRPLEDRDVLRIGATSIAYREPLQSEEETAPAEDQAALAGLTVAQRRVLEALCRPLAAPGGLGTPASNPEIAEQLQLSVEAVRTHLRALFAVFEVPDLPQNRKRAELARRAVAAGVVAPRGD